MKAEIPFSSNISISVSSFVRMLLNLWTDYESFWQFELSGELWTRPRCIDSFAINTGSCKFLHAWNKDEPIIPAPIIPIFIMIFSLVQTTTFVQIEISKLFFVDQGSPVCSFRSISDKMFRPMTGALVKFWKTPSDDLSVDLACDLSYFDQSVLVILNLRRRGDA